MIACVFVAIASVALCVLALLGGAVVVAGLVVMSGLDRTNGIQPKRRP